MSSKKEQTTQLSASEQTQVQDLLTRYHQIAERLHASDDLAHIHETLADLTTGSEAFQIALPKELAKEQHSDAADILAALNALSPHKEQRKEARRGLLRLAGSRTYARWQAPAESTPAIQAKIQHPPRFWQGWVTQSREQGEVQLILCWEQGYDYSEIRVLTFLLDFWFAGVKDVLDEVLTHRKFDERLNQARRTLTDTTLVDCTLAEGKRLIQEAILINTARGAEPAKEYRTILPHIQTLILNASDPGTDRGSTFITPELEPHEVIINFIGAWSFGDFGLAYDLLSADCELRTEQSRDEWIQQHQLWHKEAQPVRMELGFTHELQARQSTLWLPGTFSTRSNTHKEIEIGWSLELVSTPLSGTLKEMPMGTAVNKETGRHWFWTSYTLMRENDAWRIQHIKDEGLAVQSLSIQELQERHTKINQELEELNKKRDQLDSQELIEEMSWRLVQALHYYDAMIAQLPLDYTTLANAYNMAVLLGHPERILVYLERMTQRFSDNKNDNLRRLAATLVGLASGYNTPGMQARVRHLLARTEEILRELTEQEPVALNYGLLGEFLLSEHRNEDAEMAFQRAQELGPTSEQAAGIEVGLGHVSMRREQFTTAITHYQRAAELEARYPGIWFNLGFAQRRAGRLSDAERSYQEAIQVNSDDTRAFMDLAALYMNSGREKEARTLLELAVRHHPEAGELHALLASILEALGEHSSAQRSLEEAQRIAPDLDIVQQVRQQIQKSKR